MISKTRTLRVPRNPIGLLILLAAFAGAAGCSTSNTTGGGGGVVINHVNASGSSVPGWLTPTGGAHANSATMDYISTGGNSSCTECHGSDLAGGISGVSCFGNTAGCHHGSIPNWSTPAVHGASAKRAPGSSGFASCQICHGADFRTVRGGLTCFTCHGVSAPHPAAPWHGPTFTHVDTNPANAPVCAQCHFFGSPNNPANHPATPPPAGTPPGCFNNTLCHGENPVPHPVGTAWVAAPPAAQPHGNSAKAAPSPTNGFAYCQVCHGSGTDFAGGVARDCYTCHTVNAPHPPLPWRASAGTTYTHTNTNTGNASVCAFCHRNANPGTPDCFNNTLCHGPSGATHNVPFNDVAHYDVVAATFAGECGPCHDVSAPSTKAGPVCQTCHVAGSPLAALNCTSCHASPPSGAAPAGAAFPNVPGAHVAHIALNGTGSPVTCDTCHAGLGSRTLEHYNRARPPRTAPGDVAFTATYDAQTGASSFDNSAALRCSNVSCHGGQATPNWQTGAIDVNTACTGCHALGTTQFNSYVSGEHNQESHRLFPCVVCHNTTTLAANHFTALGTPAMEGPASATIDGAGTFVVTYVPATQSCSPQAGVGCHGTRLWVGN